MNLQVKFRVTFLKHGKARVDVYFVNEDGSLEKCSSFVMDRREVVGKFDEYESPYDN